MHRNSVIFFITVLLIAMSATGTIAQEAAFPRHPAVSPDGKNISFSYGGDIWTVSALGGRAFRLTTAHAYECFPRWSPDGRCIAFTANREENDDVFIIPAKGGQSNQLTWHESDDMCCDWTPDGKAVIFSSRRDDMYPDLVMLYSVRVEGGTPVPLMDGYGTEATVSPDSHRMLYTKSGKNTRWWRKHYRGSASPQVWLYEFNTGQHIAVTDTGSHETGDDYRRSPSRLPMWGTDGSVYITAEPDDTPNIYKLDTNGNRAKITDYSGDGVRFPSISRNGRVIAYEQGLSIYVIEDEGPANRLEIIAPLDNPEMSVQQIRYTDKAERLAFSPDGQQMFIEVRGEVFAGRIVGKDDKAARGRANPLSGNDPARDGDFTVSPGGDSLIFTSDRSGNRDLYLAFSSDPEAPELSRAFDITIEQITVDSTDDHSPQWSPDGRQVAFKRGKGDLIILDLESGEERKLLEGWSLLQFAWSPDGRWIGFAREDDEYNSDVFIIPAEGGSEVNISRHPDEDDLPVWSADGRKLAFRSKRDKNDLNLHYLFLRLEDHYKTPADWAEEERQAKKSSKKGKDDKKKKKKEDKKQPVEVVIDTTEIYRRVRLVTRLAGEDDDKGEFAISPDGKQYAYVSDHQGERDIYIIDWTGEDVKRLTKDGEDPRFISFSADGKRIRYLTGSGKVKSVTSGGKKSDNHPFDARVSVDFTAERRQKFSEVWRVLNDRFYHPDFHGYDWAEIGDKYSSLIDAASCERDFGDIVNMMFGELNSSHMGYRSPSLGHCYSTGRLGLDFDFSDEGPGLLVKHVQPKSPCARIKDPVITGDRLIAVNGTMLERGVNLHRLLQDQVGQQVELVIGSGKKERKVVVQSMGAWLHGTLRYDEWVSDRRAMVDSLSGGSLGYIHLRGMGESSLSRFEAQLFSQATGRDALVIDVRYNGGGWTTDYILTMIQVRRHAVTFPRDGGPGYPQGRLPLYSWVKPITVLCNEFSFSNAEIFSHSIKTLTNWKLVGVPTPGGVISTTVLDLLDGSTFRLPLRGWYFGTEPQRDPERNMEGNGAVPDIIIPLEPDELTVEDDHQLETAVVELLKIIQQR